MVFHLFGIFGDVFLVIMENSIFKVSDRFYQFIARLKYCFKNSQIFI